MSSLATDRSAGNSSEMVFCCTNCFLNEQIIDYIEESGHNGNCNFCLSEDVNICETTVVGDFIRKGFDKLYEDAVHSVLYCSREGGYQLATYDIYDILNDTEQIFSDEVSEPSDLIDALSVYDGTIPFVSIDPYDPLPGPSRFHTPWERFSDLVKHARRYTALIAELGYDFDSDTYVDHLRRIVEIVRQYATISINQGSILYRARVWSGDEKPKPEDLTCPSPEYTVNSRMNPSGIPVFYGALEEDTTIHEVRPHIGEKVAVGYFKTLKPIFVINLCALLEPRDRFDPQYEPFRDGCVIPFISQFAIEISRPIRRSDRDIEYIPTQVFAEILKYEDRSVTSGHQQEPIKGIIFGSSVREDGRNIVLFLHKAMSARDDSSDVDEWLKFVEYRMRVISSVNVDYER